VLVNGAERGDAIELEAARTKYNEASSKFEQVRNSDDALAKSQAERAMRRARARFQAAGGNVQI